VAARGCPVNRHTGGSILVFDGDCAFCTTCAQFVQRWVSAGGFTSVAPWQGLDLAELGLSAQQCQAAVQWVDEHGHVASGHAAIAAALRAGRAPWRPVGALLVAPGFSWLAEHVYSWICEHRHALPGWIPAFRTHGTGHCS